jgi:hypothetical protein
MRRRRPRLLRLLGLVRWDLRSGCSKGFFLGEVGGVEGDGWMIEGRGAERSGDGGIWL